MTVPNTKNRKQAARRQRVAAMRAQNKRAERRRNIMTLGSIGAVCALVIGLVAWYAVSRGGNGATASEVIPPALTGTADVQPAAVTVASTTGIKGVVAYDTAGWPATSHNGPSSGALRHTHVTTPVTYQVTPPVGGDHYGTWLTCGIYGKPVPSEYAVHDLEHGAIWITYQPSLPTSEVNQLRSFAKGQSVIAGSRYMTLSPYTGLPSPIVVSSWGFQLRLSSPSDPRLQQFVNKFRVSKAYSPEYGGECTGGIGTPLES